MDLFLSIVVIVAVVVFVVIGFIGPLLSNAFTRQRSSSMCTNVPWLDRLFFGPAEKKSTSEWQRATNAKWPNDGENWR